MSIKAKAAFFLAAVLALAAPLTYAQESTADPEGFPQVQGTFNNSNIRDCAPNYPVVGVLSGSESFYIVNIESRVDGFEYYEIVSADDSDPYAGCVRADVLVPFLDPTVSIDAVKAALDERKIPTLDALAQRWHEGKGVNRSRVIPLSTVENDGKVPERLTVDRANQLLEQAQAQGIAGAAILIVHNGGTGESLEYDVIVLDSEGTPYYQVGAADNQASQDQESYLEAPTLAPEGAMAIEFTPGGPHFVGINEYKQVIYQFNLEGEEWEAVEVPEFDILSEDEMQVVKDFLATNGIQGEVGRKVNTPEMPGLDQTRFEQGIVVGRLSEHYYVLFVPTQPNGEGWYIGVYADEYYGLNNMLLGLRSKIAEGNLSNIQLLNGQLVTYSNNYDINPSLSEKFCQFPTLGNNASNCREYIASIGIGRQESVLDFSTTDPALLAELQLPYIAIGIEQ